MELFDYKTNRTEKITKPEASKCVHLISSPSIIKITKLKIIRWAGHIARMGAMRSAYGILLGK
jgi:hypothetical protein